MGEIPNGRVTYSTQLRGGAGGQGLEEIRKGSLGEMMSQVRPKG